MKIFSRRAVIKLGGVAIGALATGAWRSRQGSDDSAATAALAAGCILAPEQTEGPYYIAKEKVRKNITEGRPGTLLKLRFAVLNASTCKPIKGAAVDIWHCDSGGVYAGFEAASKGGPPGGGSGPTDKHTYLRGIQLTNAHGACEFQTIYPGWYRGRTVHIHVKVHLHNDVTGHVVHTGQLFFADTLTTKVYQSTPYKSRAASRDTLNSGDSVYRSGGTQSMLTMQKNRDGSYTGTIALGVKTV
jgi:protocatechuate 3,4-dioxygenase beta subunit